jgi:hypothetical protein
MRRPPALLGAAALVLALWACNDPAGAEHQSKSTAPALVPYGTDGITPEDTKPPTTKPHRTTTTKAAPDTTDASSEDTTDTTGPSQEHTVDPMPGDTATFDTLGLDDPLCAAAQHIVDLDDKYQKALDKALAGDDDAVVKVLSKLPVDDFRNAYDDLAAEVSTSLRRKVALIRDFTVKYAEELAAAPDLQTVSEIIAATEADPDASKVVKAKKTVSAYTDDKCGVTIAKG